MPELDALDKKIFELLAENGRMSNLELAGHVGVSEKTVRQRIRRLIERMECGSAPLGSGCGAVAAHRPGAGRERPAVRRR